MLTAVSIHPRAGKITAIKGLHRIISTCVNDNPNTLSIVVGDINHANLECTMPEYKQYATCPSRNNTILDLYYCKVKKAYKSVSRTCYGDADHATIMMTSINKRKLKCCRFITKPIMHF